MHCHNKYPFYGIRKIRKWLEHEGYRISKKKVKQLMKGLGIKTIYPKKNTSIPNKEHEIFPYLLKDLKITKPDQVWCADISYIKMPKGYAYLVAIMDWKSRYVLSWSLSNSLEKSFCIEALRRALQKSKPHIFNTDQGSQFTSNEFTQILKKEKIKISMDGKGSYYDNIVIERLWRTVKYEEVYIKEYKNIIEAYRNLKEYFEFYNNERFHQSLDYKTPAQAYWGKDYKLAETACLKEAA